MNCCDLHLTVQEEDPITLEITEATIKPEQSKTVTPTYSEQTVLPDAGMTLGSVTVEPIPDPTDHITITENGSYDVARIGGVDVDVPQGVFPEGTLEVTQNGPHDVREFERVDVNVAPIKGPMFTEYDDDGYPTEVRVYGMTTIPYWYFYGWGAGTYNRTMATSKIKRVVLNDEVATVSDNVFRSMNRLETIVFSKAISSIGIYNFADTARLKLLDFSRAQQVPTLAAYNNSYAAGCVIRVPSALLDEWQTAPVWRDLTNVIFEGV